MKSLFKKPLAFLVLALMAVSVFAVPASAQLKREQVESDQMISGFKSTFGESISGEAGIFKQIGVIVNIMFSLAGLILLVIIVQASFIWLTAGGNTEQVTKAKRNLRNGIVGIVIVLLAVPFAQFVLSQIDKLFTA